MNPEDIRLAIPQYLSNQLSPAERAAFEARIQADSGLRAETEELRAMWLGLGLLPEEQPSAALRARFYQKLNAISKGSRLEARPQSAWWKLQPAQQIAAAAVLFFAGVAVGHRQIASTGELSQLRGQIQNLQQVIALSMLDHQSASARLEGVSWGSKMDHPEGQVSTALLTALNHDSNVNVRLSSADALAKFAGDASVRAALIHSLPVQDSPLVQIALIDTLVQIHATNSAGEFRRLAADQDTNPNVRQHAQWALHQLGL